MSARCPTCRGENILYVQSVMEYHRMNDLPNEYGEVDLMCLEDSIPDDDTDPYLHCTDCVSFFDLQGGKLHQTTIELDEGDFESEEQNEF